MLLWSSIFYWISFLKDFMYCYLDMVLVDFFWMCLFEFIFEMIFFSLAAEGVYFWLDMLLVNVVIVEIYKVVCDKYFMNRGSSGKMKNK